MNGVTRSKVIAEAVAIVEERGLEALTLTAIAKELGVSQPAVYRHVANHQEVLQAVSLHGRLALADVLADAAIGRAGDDAIRAVGHAWRSFVRRHPHLYIAIDACACAGVPELEEAVERVVGVLESALQSHRLSEELRVHAARTMRSAFHGFTDIEARQGHPSPHELDDTFEHLLDFLCAGVDELSRRVDRVPAVDGKGASDGRVGGS